MELVDKFEQVLAQWPLEWRSDGLHQPEATAVYCQRDGIPERIRFVAYDGDELLLWDSDRGDDEARWIVFERPEVVGGGVLRKNQIIEPLEFEEPLSSQSLHFLDRPEFKGAMLQFVDASGVRAEIPAKRFMSFCPEWLGMRDRPRVILRMLLQDGSTRRVEFSVPSPLDVPPGEGFDLWIVP
jgi:hypothetical protein